VFSQISIYMTQLVIIFQIMVLFLKMTRQFLCRKKVNDHLELKLVGELTLLEAERSTKIVTEVGNTLDGSKDSLVNSLLVGGLRFRVDLLLLLTLEEFFLRTLLVADSLLGEIGIVELLIDLSNIKLTIQFISAINSRTISYLSLGKVDLGGGGDNVSLVDTSQWDTVDLVGTSDEQKARLKSLKADNTLSAETASKEDEHGSGSDGRAGSLSLSSLARDLGLGDILSGVEARSLVSGDNTLLTTLKFDGLVSSSVLGSSLDLGLLVLEETLLGVDSAAREA
jgi:hypothetical protein